VAVRRHDHRKLLIGGMPAATVGSMATNNPPHGPPGGPFQVPPTNQGTVMQGSAMVLIDGKPAARSGDPVQPGSGSISTITAVGMVLFG